MSLEVAVDHRQGAFRLDAAFRSAGRLTALFGRSGSGKTTLVNAIAGLVRPERARIVVDGTVLADTGARMVLPKHRRRIGYVFQEGRLFPHLTVRQNLLFGRFFAGGEGGPALEEVVGLLGIGPLLARRPGGLSGGEKQRVAIGRALLARPRLLLMDEPLASLDEARKAELLPYIERLRDEVGVPIVYVSHALAEVARLATDVVVLEDGRVAAAGPAAEVLGGTLAPPSLAGDREAGAVLDGRVVGHDEGYGLTRIDTAVGPIRLPRLNRPLGAATRILVRARDVMLALDEPQGVSALNVIPGTVAAVGEGEGPWVEVRLACGDGSLIARVTRKSVDALALRPGRPVHAVVKSVALHEGATHAGRTKEGEVWPA